MALFERLKSVARFAESVNTRYFVTSKLKWLLVSTTVSSVLLVGGYEVTKNVQYYRWRENFDNYGWFDKVTIPSRNPVLMWEYRSYGKYVHARIRTNRYGFRDRDYKSTKKPCNTFRVAFAGDSITLGLGIHLRETFVRQFEMEASRMKSQPRVQALNFGVDGYNTPQILEVVRTKVLPFSPDKVVYVMCLNDFDFDESSGEKILYFRKPKSFFLLTLEKALQRLQGGDFHRFHFKKNKMVVFQSILDMKEILEPRGIDFQVVLVPVFPDRPLTFDDYPLLDVHQEIGEFSKEKAISLLDLRAAFAASGGLPRDYALDVWHPNVKGHRFIAEQLLSSVLSD
ncbi:MAG: SGNH/GDSL hydrolase family protein [bacterium]|nr:SGNH/GDSL hydrolase family protein [bacterium]